MNSKWSRGMQNRGETHCEVMSGRRWLPHLANFTFQDSAEALWTLTQLELLKLHPVISTALWQCTLCTCANDIHSRETREGKNHFDWWQSCGATLLSTSKPWLHEKYLPLTSPTSWFNRNQRIIYSTNIQWSNLKEPRMNVSFLEWLGGIFHVSESGAVEYFITRANFWRHRGC